MSEIRQVLDSLCIVMTKCFSGSEDIGTVRNLFKKANLITAHEYEEAEKNPNNAISHMLSCMNTNEETKVLLVNSFIEKEFPGEEPLKELLTNISTGDKTDEIEWFLGKWDRFDECKSEIQYLSKKSWAEINMTGKHPWQVYFIHQCSTENNREIVEKIRNDVQAIFDKKHAMDELSKEVLDNIRTVMTKCFTEPDEIHTIRNLFKEGNIITSSEYQQAESNPQDAITFILSCNIKNQKPIKLLINSFLKSEFPGDEILKDVLNFLATDKPTGQIKYFLKNWERIDECKEEIETMLKQQWPDVNTTGKYPWQLYFVHRCSMETDRNIVENVGNEVCTIISKNKPDSNSKLVEFRVKLDETPASREELYISTIERRRYQMIFDDRGWYHCSVTITSPLKYKYVIINKEEDKLMYECFPVNLSLDGWRILDLNDEVAIHHDFAMFQNYAKADYAKKGGDIMFKYLYAIEFSDESSAIDELSCLVASICNGCTWDSEATLSFDQTQFEDELILFLGDRTFTNELKRNEGYCFSLSVLLALCKHAKNRLTEKLIAQVFKMLNITQIPVNDHKNLRDFIVKEFTKSKYSKSDSKIAISHLLKIASHESYSTAEWLLVLPLMWILQANIDSSTIPDQSLVLSEHVDWDKMSGKCSKKEFQRSLLTIWPDVEKISNVFPWILECFLYLAALDTQLEVAHHSKDYEKLSGKVGKLLLERLDLREVIREKDGIKEHFLRLSKFKNLIISYLKQLPTKSSKIVEKIQDVKRCIEMTENKSDEENIDFWRIIYWWILMTETVLKSLDDKKLILKNILTCFEAKYISLESNWLKVCCDIIECDWEDKKFEQKWRKKVKKRFEDFMTQERNKDEIKILELYLEDNFCCKGMQTKIFKLAESCFKSKSTIEKIRRSGEHFSRFFKNDQRYHDLLCKIYDKFILDLHKNCKSMTMGEKPLMEFWKQLLQSPIIDAIDMFDKDEMLKFRSLFEKCIESKEVIDTCFSSLIKQIIRRNLTVNDFSNLLERKHKLDTVKETTFPTHDLFSNSFDECKTKLEAIETKHNEAKFCRDFLAKWKTEPETKLLVEISAIADTIIDHEKIADLLKLFPQQLTTFIDVVYCIKDTKFLEEAMRLQIHDMQIEKFYQLVDDWMSDIKNGNVSFEILDRIFNANEEEISSTLEKLNESLQKRDISDKRKITDISSTSRRICNCLILTDDQLPKVWKSVKDFSQHFQKMNDVNTLKEIIGQSKVGNKLQNVTEEVSALITSLQKCKEQTSANLSAFIEQTPLLQWLRDILKDVAELKIMCDLAMISAGENNNDVSNVSCLLSAGMGYAQLVFEPNEITSLSVLLEFFEPMEKKEKLLSNWTNSGTNLEWFKNIMGIYGSTEKNTLSSMKKICENARYIIGYNENSIPKESECFEGLVNDKDKQITYHLSDFRDLKAKLNLLNLNHENTCKRFLEIFNAVEMLLMSFVKVLQSGCMLYKNWRVIIKPCQIVSNANNVNIDVCYGENTKHIVVDTAVTDIFEMAHVLQESCSRWEDYLEKKYRKFYYLNYFNVQQINVLCAELAHFRKDRPLDQALDLLSLVLRKETCKDMYGMFKTHLDNATKMEENFSDENIPQATGNRGEPKSEVAALRELVIRHNISEDAAKAAVYEKGFQNIDDCLDWALLEATSDEIKAKSKLFEKKQAPGATSERPIGLPDVSIFENRSSHSLRNVITKLVQSTTNDKVLTAMASICYGYFENITVLSLRDFLNVEHLGKFLTSIATSPLYRQLPNYDLHKGMKKGIANLVVCDDKYTIAGVLSLYMKHRNLPLPSASEVLMCSSNTTKDEALRFLRRAMCKNGLKGNLVYSMTSIHKLTFHVARAIEAEYTSLQKDASLIDPEYQLVAFTSDEKDYLETCFTKRVALHRETEDQIRKYLACKLKRVDASDGTSGKESGRQVYQIDKDGFVVRVVKSHRPGVGKSLLIKRMFDTAVNNGGKGTIVRCAETDINRNKIIEKFHSEEDINFFHIDLMPVVIQENDEFFFELFVLGRIENDSGKIWLRKQHHVYAVEMNDFDTQMNPKFRATNILNLLPYVTCLSPEQTLLNLNANDDELQRIARLDVAEIMTSKFLLPYSNLKQSESSFFRISNQTTEKPEDVINTFLKEYGGKDPSWAEINYFASFLHYQLENCEKSEFIKFSNQFNKLKKLAIYFMLKIAHDLVTSLYGESKSEATQIYSDENSYIFFNDDRQSMSFVNVNINDEGDLLGKNGEILQRRITTPHVVAYLEKSGVNLGKKYKRLDSWNREEMVKMLCRFVGVRYNDPDPTYQLTSDNMIKLMKTHVRLRSGIPIVFTGETGTGKTRMMEFLIKLKTTSIHMSDISEKSSARCVSEVNYFKMKIHGGISVDEFYTRMENKLFDPCGTLQKQRPYLIFFDEANTTSAVYGIKELMCDNTVNGKSIGNGITQFVAACNPHKKLTQTQLNKIRNCGLGAAKHDIKSGSKSPIQELVYRVVELPPSMKVVECNFGNVIPAHERIYIEQMAKKFPAFKNFCNEIVSVILDTQLYMRKLEDENCKYVSLRDVERCLNVLKWFYERASSLDWQEPNIPKTVWALVQAVDFCYCVSVSDKESFRKYLAQSFRNLRINIPVEHIIQLTKECRIALIKDIKVENDVSWNEALRENTFMITICSELKIPLFLIGKPGSSKSLAKGIVSSNMLGKQSTSELYKKMKQIHMLSFQCSALTDARGIETVFKQCVDMQEKNPESYVAVVVLDEIGLAEASEKMPLKVLHPLLEAGTTDDVNLSDIDQNKRVGFVGISNWAIDPAKLNRGIFVIRDEPTRAELKTTALDIFKAQRMQEEIKSKGEKSLYWQGEINTAEIKVLDDLTSAYLEICQKQQNNYYGLRDFYSTVKMISKCKSIDDILLNLKRIILRNFSGGPMDYMPIFNKYLQMKQTDSLDTSLVLIKDNDRDHTCRFLLLLTENILAVWLLKSIFEDYQIIFGSGFPGDHNYAQICHNISRIKECMETGQKVILLNMSQLHESLYDVLNQYYMKWQDQNLVDLGLGGQRFKCKISEKFKLIVVEKKDVVFEEYPIPLINRMEKHHFFAQNLIDYEQKSYAGRLQNWISKFCKLNEIEEIKNHPENVFVGYNNSTAASVILAYHNTKSDYDTCRNILLQAASSDAVVRLTRTNFASDEVIELQNIYSKEQHHDNLWEFLQDLLTNPDKYCTQIFFEIVSYSNILSENDRLLLQKKVSSTSIAVINIRQFHTQQEYIDNFMQVFESDNNYRFILIQCRHVPKYVHMIESSKLAMQNYLQQNYHGRKAVSVLFIFSTDRQLASSSAKDTGIEFQYTVENQIYYIDELRPDQNTISSSKLLQNKPICDVINDSINNPDAVGGLQFTDILNDNLCEAVCKLLSRTRNSSYMNSVKLLRNIIAHNEEFNKLLSQHVNAIIQTRKTPVDVFDSWIVQECSSLQSLLEHGSVGKTLWERIKKEVVDVLTYIVSSIGQYNNLLLLDFKETKLTNLWLALFKQYDLINQQIQYSLVSSQAEVLFPFSFWLIANLERHYSNPARTNQCSADDMVSFFKASPMRKALRDDEFDSELLCDSFLTDLLKSQLSCELSHRGMNIIRRILQNTIEVHGNSWLGIPVAFFTIKCHRGILEHFLTICKACKDVEEGIRSDDTKYTSPIDMLSKLFEKMLVSLNKQADNLSNKETVENWKTYFNHAKLISTFVDIQQKDDWNRILLMYHCLDQLLPADHNYINVTLQNIKRLWKNVKRYGFKSQSFLKIVSNVCSSSFNEVKCGITMDWKYPMCSQCDSRIIRPQILSCQHFVCEDCADNIHKAQSYSCSECGTKESIKMPELSKSSLMEIEMFEQSCTRFFTNCIVQFLLSPNIQQDILNVIVKNVVAASKLNATNDQKIILKDFDLDVATQSYIMDTILSNGLRDKMMKSLNYVVEKDFSLVAALHCLEFRSIHLQEGNYLQAYERLSSLLLNKQIMWKKSLTLLEKLETVAEIRTSLKKFAQYLFDNSCFISVDADDVKQKYMSLVKTMILNDKSDTMLKYLIKIGCKIFGKVWIERVQDSEAAKDLLSAHIWEEVRPQYTDHFLLYGETYVLAKSKLRESMGQNLEAQKEDLLNVLLQSDGAEENLAALNFLQAQHHTGSNLRYSKKPYDANNTSILQILANVECEESLMRDILNQIIISVKVCLAQKKHLMEGFHIITERPQDAHTMFLPGMQEHVYFSLENATSNDPVALYLCPQNHIYMIGECTRPYVQAKCFCGEVIGGAFHEAARGNRKMVSLLEDSQKGYQLSKNSTNMVNASDRTSKPEADVMQLLLHACLLIGLQIDDGAIQRLLKIEGKHRCCEYLSNQLVSGLRQLSTTLARNMDEIVIMIHIVLLKISMTEPTSSDVNISWKTMEYRRRWEQRFCEIYLRDILLNLDTEIYNAQAKLEELDKLHRLVHEMDTDAFSGFDSWENSVFWQHIEHYSTNRLLHFVMNRDDGKLLQRILSTHHLECLRHLHTILKLQTTLIQRYEFKLDLGEADKRTFSDLQTDEELQTLINVYIKVWNELIPAFRLIGENVDMLTLRSSIAYGLPSERGRGRVAKRFAKFLMNMQNEFLDKTGLSVETVSVSNVKSTDIVQIDDSVLFPIIRAHEIYKIETDKYGRHHYITYSVQALEKTITEKLIKNKKKILINTIPLMKYPQDIGIGSDWEFVMKKQVKLTWKVEEELKQCIESKSFVEICESIRSLTYAITYLANEKSYNPDQPLHEFMQSYLMLRSEQIGAIPESSNCGHVLRVYGMLNCYKQIELIEKGVKPFRSYLLGDQRIISDKEPLSAQLSKIKDLSLLQQQLHEIIVQTPDFNPDWSLSADIAEDFKFLDGDGTNREFLKMIPSDIVYANIVDLFRSIVDYQIKAASKYSESQSEWGIEENEIAEGGISRQYENSEIQLKSGLERRITRKFKEILIGSSCETAELNGCSLSFPISPNLEGEKLSLSLIIDNTTWPSGYIPVCPILDCKPSGLIFDPPVCIRLKPWVAARKNAQIPLVVLYSNENSVWKEETSILLGRNNELEFECRHFTFYFIGYLWDSVRSLLGILTYRVKAFLYQTDCGRFCILLCVDDKTLLDGFKDELKDNGFKNMFPIFENMVVTLGDEIMLSVTSQNPNRIITYGGNAQLVIKIDNDFVTKLIKHKYFTILPTDVNDDRPVNLFFNIHFHGQEESYPLLLKCQDTRRGMRVNQVIQHADQAHIYN